MQLTFDFEKNERKYYYFPEGNDRLVDAIVKSREKEAKKKKKVGKI